MDECAESRKIRRDQLREELLSALKRGEVVVFLRSREGRIDPEPFLTVIASPAKESTQKPEKK